MSQQDERELIQILGALNMVVGHLKVNPTRELRQSLMATSERLQQFTQKLQEQNQ